MLTSKQTLYHKHRPHIRRIAVLFPEFLGDYLCLVPLLHGFQHHFPEAHLIAFVTPPIQHIVAQHPAVNEATLIGDWNSKTGKKALIQTLKQGQFDLAYFTSDPLFWIAKAAGIPWRMRERNTPFFRWQCLGFVPVADGRYYDTAQRHMENLSMLIKKPVPVSDYCFDPGLPEAAIAHLHPRLTPKTYVALNSDTHTCKRFDRHILVQVITHLCEKGEIVFLIGLKDPFDLDSVFSEHPNVVSLVGKTSLSEAFSVIRHAKVFVGFDKWDQPRGHSLWHTSTDLFPTQGCTCLALRLPERECPLQATHHSQPLCHLLQPLPQLCQRRLRTRLYPLRSLAHLGHGSRFVQYT